MVNDGSRRGDKNICFVFFYAQSVENDADPQILSLKGKRAISIRSEGAKGVANCFSALFPSISQEEEEEEEEEELDKVLLAIKGGYILPTPSLMYVRSTQ